MNQKKAEKEIVIALKKASSHLSNVIQMMENKKYCIEILQQNLAVIGLLRSANNKLLKKHLHTCFAFTMKSNNEKRQQAMIEEIIKINTLTNK